jgi:molybdate transport repressor ModE-like protein
VNADRLLSLELRHLAALTAIAEEGTFAGAARRLGYTQSAVSQQIVALERIAGACLVERRPGRRPVGLTAAGALMLRHGAAILARAQAVEADLAAAANGAGGSVGLGTYQSIGVHVLPALLPRLRAAFPHVDVQLRESASDFELLDLVERGELDLTFADLPLTEGPFEHVELLRDPYVLLVASDSPLAARSTPPPASELARLDLIGFRNCRSTVQLESALRQPLRFVFRSDHNGTVQGLVGAGVGAALVPRLTVDPNDESTTAIDLGPKFPPRLIALAWHRDRYRSPAALALVQLAREVCAELEPEPVPA